MISLGKLSAGLAHELNNPAAAIERCAALLQIRIAESEQAARSLAAIVLSHAQIAALDRLREACLANREDAAERSPIDQMNREEAMTDWLNAHNLGVTYARCLLIQMYPSRCWTNWLLS